MPRLPISKTQLDRLGDRLRDADDIDPADRDLLEAVLDIYEEAREIVRQHLAGLGFEPIARVKTMGTTIDKLRRRRNCRLKTVHDLAGTRVVLAGDLRTQDRVVEAFRYFKTVPELLRELADLLPGDADLLPDG